MKSDSRRTPPAARPRSGRSGPSAPKAGGGAGPAAAHGAELSHKSVLELQQVLGNRGVAEIIGERERAGAGEKLDAPTREAMETRFGEDFSGVEVHTGREAAKEAARFGADAYTAKERIVFGTGAYEPETQRGQELLSHELAHVVQQRQGGSAGERAPDKGEAQRAEAEADQIARGEQQEVRQPVAAGAVQAKESPLANTELSEEAAQTLQNIRDAAGERWQDFEEWWGVHQSSALAKVESEEDSTEFSQITQAMEFELKDTFRETADALARAGAQLREVNPEGKQQLDVMVQLLTGNAYLADRDAQGIGRLLETIKLFYTLKQIEDTAEKLKRINVADNPRIAGARFDRLFSDLMTLGERIPGGVPDFARVLQDLNRSGYFFREAEGISAPDDEIYRQLWEEFRKLD